MFRLFLSAYTGIQTRVASYTPSRVRAIVAGIQTRVASHTPSRVLAIVGQGAVVAARAKVPPRLPCLKHPLRFSGTPS